MLIWAPLNASCCARVHRACRVRGYALCIRWYSQLYAEVMGALLLRCGCYILLWRNVLAVCGLRCKNLGRRTTCILHAHRGNNRCLVHDVWCTVTRISFSGIRS